MCYYFVCDYFVIYGGVYFLALMLKYTTLLNMLLWGTLQKNYQACLITERSVQ